MIQNQIEKKLKIHKYDVPLIIEIKTGFPNADYLKWFFKLDKFLGIDSFY